MTRKGPSRATLIAFSILFVLFSGVLMLYLAYSFYFGSAHGISGIVTARNEHGSTQTMSTSVGLPLKSNNLLSLVPDADTCHFGMPYHYQGKNCCLCPKLTTGDRCEDLGNDGKRFTKLTTCYGDWNDIDKYLEKKPDTWSEMGITTHRMKDFVNRYVRWYDGRDTCQLAFSNTVDTYFHNAALQYGPWTQNDVIVLHMLHRFNQYMFLQSESQHGALSFDTPTVPGKILFVLMFYHEPELSENLLRTVISKNHYYILSISKTAEQSYRRHMMNLVSSLNLQNVIILPDEWSIDGNWSDVSLLYMEMVPVMYAMLHGWIDWSYKIVLSETHFPAKNIRDLSEFLAQQRPETVFSEHTAKPRDRIETVQIFLDGLCRNVQGMHTDFRHLASNTVISPPQGGSQWHVIPRNVLMYIFSGKLSIDYLLVTKQSAVPDE
jgi:hypothetical protein